MKTRMVRSANFSVGKGKSLIIGLSSSFGLYRIVLENENGVVKVRAEGASKFEFRNKPRGRGECDFWLGNPPHDTVLQDYLDRKFWNQFNWGELVKYHENAKLKRALKAEIKKLVEEFDGKAARRLNSILKKHKQTKK